LTTAQQPAVRGIFGGPHAYFAHKGIIGQGGQGNK
jgi:hypothetical protein